MVKLDVMDKSENVYFPKIYIVNGQKIRKHTPQILYVKQEKVTNVGFDISIFIIYLL